MYVRLRRSRKKRGKWKKELNNSKLKWLLPVLFFSCLVWSVVVSRFVCTHWPLKMSGNYNSMLTMKNIRHALSRSDSLLYAFTTCTRAPKPNQMKDGWTHSLFFFLSFSLQVLHHQVSGLWQLNMSHVWQADPWEQQTACQPQVCVYEYMFIVIIIIFVHVVTQLADKPQSFAKNSFPSPNLIQALMKNILHFAMAARPRHNSQSVAQVNIPKLGYYSW